MKQVLVRSGEIVVEEVPAPAAEPGTVLVAVDYSAVSAGTELGSISASGKPLWKKALDQPEKVKRAVDIVRTEGVFKARRIVEGKVSSARPIGYSCAGSVVEIGDGVTDLSPGQRVACAGAGIAMHAEVVCVPRNLVVPIPEAVGLREAATATLGAIALQGVRRADPTLGETFVVIGLGPIGQLTVRMLKADGCRVFGSDLDSSRVQRALAAGMDGALAPDDAAAAERVRRATGGHGADGVIITAAASGDEIVSMAFGLCRRKGRVVLVGDVGLGIDRADIYEKELDFLVSTSYGPGRYDPAYEERGLEYPIGYVRWTENRNMAAYLDLIADGRLDVASLIDKVHDVDDAAAAYAALDGGEERPLVALLGYPRQVEDRLARTVGTPAAAPSGRDRVSIAVVGAGSFAKSTHLPNLAGLDREFGIAAIVSRTGHNASETARQYGAGYATTDLAEVLADDAIDAVLVATRHDLHAGMALEALGAGKHVLVEKPLALDEDELARVLAFFEGRSEAPVLLTGFNRRFSPHARRLAESLRGRTAPMMLTYRMNAGYVPLDHWVHDPAVGGGRNIGEACHVYDLFTYLIGARVAEVTARAIAATGGQYGPRDNFVATISFEDGSLATLAYTALGGLKHPKEQMEVFCDGSVWALDDYRSLSVDGTNALKTAAPDKGHVEELREFAAVVRGGGEWPIPLWQQAQAMRIAFDVENALAGR